MSLPVLQRADVPTGSAVGLPAAQPNLEFGEASITGIAMARFFAGVGIPPCRTGGLIFLTLA